MTQGKTRNQRPETRKSSLWFLASFFCFFFFPSLVYSYCSKESLWIISGAEECLNRRDVGCAKLKLEPILRREPNCASALFMKGWILQFSDGRREEGAALQERAQRLDPSLAQFWERRGKAIESQLPSEAYSRFDVRFQGAEDRDKAWQAVHALNEMYGDLGRLFGEYPQGRFTVIIFTAEEFIDAWRAPFIGGFFDKRDGLIRLRVDATPGGDEELRHRARHEMTHAFLYQLYPGELPAWASEGIAEFAARYGVSQGFWKDNRLEQIRKTLKGSPWLSLQEIERLILHKRGSLSQLERAYLASEALVLRIAKERGDSWISRTIHHWRGQGGTFEQAYQALFSVTPDAEMERLRHSWE